METVHTAFFNDASNLEQLQPNSINLIVTSPPYPMIEMWDGIFSSQGKGIKTALDQGLGYKAFEIMHTILDSIWDESFRVLKPGGFACINIGDATRTINSNFMLYPNHSRILRHLIETGFSILPAIIWRKQTNAPNKFMGSGMLPAGAYVTLEHEYILIARKGNKREFKTSPEKQNRRQSAIFWEERNMFFSDIWFDIKGTRQEIADKKSRGRSAAFPFELAWRLVNMYSVKGDTVLDPFLGTGTTMAASAASARNSIGYEIDTGFKKIISGIKDNIIDLSNHHIEERLAKHLIFVKERIEAGKPLKHKNIHYDFPVITSQEKELVFNKLISIESFDETKTLETKAAPKESFKVIYSDNP